MYYYQHPARNGHNLKKHLIRVTGEGELAVPPDTASVNLGVVTEGKELIPTQQENSKVSTQVIESLIALGIPQTRIQTFDYRIESDYDYEQGKQIFRGYKVTHILQVKIEDLRIVGKVVDTAVLNGANYVSNVQFTLKNQNLFYQQALKLALTHAIEKANTIAQTLNVVLVPTPILVTESESPIPLFSQQPVTLFKGESTTQIEPGQIKIKANISAEFHYHS